MNLGTARFSASRRHNSIPITIKITADEMRYISLFESLTGANVRDCIIDDGEEKRVLFIVQPGTMGLAIGKAGANIKRVRKVITKPIEVVEYRETPEDFIKGCLMPARVRAIKVTKAADGRKIAVVSIQPEDKGVAIGREGRNIEKVRMLTKRYFDLDNVVVS